MLQNLNIAWTVVSEVLQYADSNLLSVKKIHLTHYIWRAFFLYERIECQLWEKAASQGLPITNIAFEWLFLFMKWFMHLQTCFERKSFITKITPEWTDSTRCPLREKAGSQILHLKVYIPLWTHSICSGIQMSFLRKTCITIITLEWLLFFDITDSSFWSKKYVFVNTLICCISFLLQASWLRGCTGQR